MNYRIVVALMFVLAAAMAQEKPPVPRTEGELEQALRKILGENHVPAAGVALVARDQVLWEAGLGQDSGKAVTSDSMFRVGSISKSFAALSVLMLQEQGRLSLDDPLRKLAPEIEFFNPWERTEPVRLVHLLEHTAGFDDIHLREYAHNDPDPISLHDGLAFNPKSRTSRWKPGTFFSYSNSGPAVAAYVVEKISGQRFEDFVRERIFEPLEMPGAGYLLTEEARARLVKSFRADGTTEEPYSHILVRPSGAISASPHEMAHFVQMLILRGSYGGKQLVQPSSIDRMETPTSTLAARLGLADGYGLNNATSYRNGYVFHGHGGAIDGFLASYAYLPGPGLGYIFMINAANGKAFRSADELLQDYLTRDLPKRPPTPIAEVPASNLERWTGFYEPLAPRAEASRFVVRMTGIQRVRLGEGRLYVGSLFGRGEPLLPVSGSQFRREEQPAATRVFLVSDSGDTILTGRWNGRKISAFQVWLRLGVVAAALLCMASSFLFALVWIPRKLLGRLRDAGPLSVRLLPLAAVLCVVAAVALLTVSGDDMFARFGRPTFWSWSFFILTVLFAATSGGGLIQVLRLRGAVHRGVWLHSLLVALSSTLVTVYLNFWGMIGLATWK